MEKYVDKVTFYMQCVRKTSSEPLRDLELRDPYMLSIMIARFDISRPVWNSNALTTLALRFLRGLDFLGKLNVSNPGARKREEYVYEQLGVGMNNGAQRTEPSELQWMALVRYRIQTSMRTWGLKLEQRGLVAYDAGRGRFIWSPACDQFNSSHWHYNGSLPDPQQPSTFTVDPPGYLLHYITDPNGSAALQPNVTLPGS